MSDVKTGPYAALQIRDFRQFIFARLCITLAIQIQATVVGWQIYAITKDPLSLGLMGLAEAVPAISVSLYAGHIADIIDRKKIILLTIFILLACSTSLLLFTLDQSHFLVVYGALPIYGVIFMSGFARGFLSPANFSFMPQLVSRNLYSNAVTLNSSFWQAAAIGGPVLAGFMYGFIGITASYIADTILVAASLMFYFSIPNKPVPPASAELGQGVADKIKAGLKFVFSNQIILSAISLDLFAVLFGGAMALLPIFAAEILKVGPEGLGILRSAPAIGALAMAVFITHYPIQKNVGKILLWAVAGFGLSMVAFGLSTNFWLSLCVLFLSGMFDSISVIVRGTLIHTLTPENMKGRVSAVNSIFVGSSNEIGAFESGFTAKLLGAVQSVVIGGMMTIGVVGITSWKATKLRGLHKVE